MSTITVKNILAYVQGTTRYYLYYSPFNFLIRSHIREQIFFRVKSMKSECFNNGECVMCGCKTTALQMANKSCEGVCYPPMLNKKEWNKFKECSFYLDKTNKVRWRLDFYYNIFINNGEKLD